MKHLWKFIDDYVIQIDNDLEVLELNREDDSTIVQITRIEKFNNPKFMKIMKYVSSLLNSRKIFQNKRYCYSISFKIQGVNTGNQLADQFRKGFQQDYFERDRLNVMKY